MAFFYNYKFCFNSVSNKREIKHFTRNFNLFRMFFFFYLNWSIPIATLHFEESAKRSRYNENFVKTPISLLCAEENLFPKLYNN